MMAPDRGSAVGTQSGADSTFPSFTPAPEISPPTNPPKPPLRQRLQALLKRLKPRHSPVSHLPPHLSRFLGYPQPTSNAPHEALPILPFTIVHNLSVKYETCICATLGSFVSILLIEAIMSTSTAFRNVYHSPSIVTSFGASAVLVFGVIDTPLAQPRNVMIGQLVSVVLAISITKLWVLGHPDYVDHLDNLGFYTPGFINGALCMSLALLGQMLLGAVHPPGGATALAAATDPVIVALSWHYIPVVLVSSAVMLGWALVINNLGRRRYPMYWWSPGVRFLEAVEKEVKHLKEEERNRHAFYGRDVGAVGEEMD
jgi:4-amino-4-deoxy-L-arabinose transferase-like glycosyltransferase